jgi:O-antigen/teichoic acid export membrane protein
VWTDRSSVKGNLDFKPKISLSIASLSVLGKDYKIGSVCFSTYQILPSIIEEVKADMLVRSQNNVYEWIDMFTCGLMFQPSLA